MQIHNCQPLELTSSHQEYFLLANCLTRPLSQTKGTAVDRVKVTTVSRGKSVVAYLIGSGSFLKEKKCVFLVKQNYYVREDRIKI